MMWIRAKNALRFMYLARLWALRVATPFPVGPRQL
jgi:hypothetical protein